MGLIKKIFLFVKKLGFLFQRAALNYLLAALIFVLFVNKTNIYLRRLNNISYWAEYPILYAKEKKDSRPLEFRRAIRYYKLLDQVFKGYTRTKGMIGYCYFYLGQYDKAIDYYERALALTPQYFWFDYNLGVIYYRRGDYVKAAVYFNKVAFQPPSELSRVAILASLDKLSHDDRVAMYEMAKVFAQTVRQKSQEYFLLSQKKEGNWQEVARTAEYALDGPLAQEHVKGFFLYHAGEAAYNLKMFERAAFYFEKNLEIQPKSIDAYYYLALIAREMNAAASSGGELSREEFIRNYEQNNASREESEVLPEPVFHPWATVIPVGKEIFLIKRSR